MQTVFDRPIEMAPPDSLKSNVVVLERSPSNTLPYKVTNLKKGLSWDAMFALFDATVAAPAEPRSFSFSFSEDNTELWQVACRWTAKPGDWSYQGEEALLPDDPEAPTGIQCHFAPPGSGERWTLDLKTSRLVELEEPRPVGLLTNGKETYKVLPSYDLNLNFLGRVPLAGHLFAIDQEPVAAATAKTTERLILRKSVSARDRSLIAAAASSILIVQPLADPVKDRSLIPEILAEMFVPWRDRPDAEIILANGFSFTLAEEEAPIWRSACRVQTRFRKAGEGLLGFMPPTKMYSMQCDLVSAKSHDHRTLDVETSAYFDAAVEKTRSPGRLAGLQREYELTPTYVKGSRSNQRLAGYLITSGPQPVAAVTTHPMGRVTVHNSVSLEERTLMAAVGSALLILTPDGVH